MYGGPSEESGLRERFWGWMVQSGFGATFARTTRPTTAESWSFRLICERSIESRPAEDLELFVDREAIQWGEEWAARISGAIAGTTFFIPIVTPSYFTSNQCRQELLKFVRDASRLGLEQLVMPVYWVTVPEVESEGVWTPRTKQ